MWEFQSTILIRHGQHSELSEHHRLKRRTGEAWDFQQRIFIALKILNLFVILSGQKTLLACLCIPGPAELEPGGGALCVQIGFYADISWESRCNIEIKI